MSRVGGYLLILAFLLGLAIGEWSIWYLDNTILAYWQGLAADLAQSCLHVTIPRTPM